MDSRHFISDVGFPGTRKGGNSLRQTLAVHCAASDTAYAALLEESGAVFADAGDDALRDHGETAALAVGAYHAAQEVARRLGEPVFEGLGHEGRERHFHISPVDGRFLLLSVFGNDTKFAIVRATAARTAAMLRECLAEGAGPEMPASRRATEGDLNIASDYFLAAP